MTEPIRQSSAPAARKPVLVLYLVQLAFPALLVVDILTARSLGYIRFRARESDTILLVISALWLAIGLGALAWSRDRGQFLRRASGPLTAIYMLLFCGALFEAGGRFVLRKTARVPAVRPPGMHIVSDADPKQTPGVQGKKTFSVNEIGLRGPAFPNSPEVYKIVTVGGSTTECVVLDDSEEWPHVLMEKLDAQQTKQRVWVGNAGVSGHNTAQHLALLQTLPVFKKIEVVIFMIGANDLEASLAFEGAPAEAHLDREAERFRQSLLAGGTWEYRLPLYKHLAVFGVVKRAGAVLAAKFKPEGVQQEWRDLSKLRERRAKAPAVPLPDLQTGLEEYRQRILHLARECQTLQIRCLYVTQPSLWRADLNSDEQHLLWMGNVGRWESPKGYGAVAELAGAIEAYNHALLDTCGQSHLECYDLASVVPKNSTVFYDDYHFNESGARAVAEALANYLLGQPPFR